MKHKKKSRLAAAEFLAVLIVTAVVFTKGLSAALAWRGYKAVGGEFMLLLLPIIYYEAKRIILDFVADFVELYAPLRRSLSVSSMRRLRRKDCRCSQLHSRTADPAKLETRGLRFQTLF